MTLTDPVYLLKHPAPKQARQTGADVSAATYADYTQLLPANPARVKFSLQNRGTSPLVVRIGGTSTFDLRGATSLGSGDGGSIEEVDARGEIEVFGESVSFSWMELTL